MNELGFAMPKARSKAQLMIDMMENGTSGDRHLCVRVPGSNQVREIIFYDGEDVLLEQDLDLTESKKVKAFENKPEKEAPAPS